MNKPTDRRLTSGILFDANVLHEQIEKISNEAAYEWMYEKIFRFEEIHYNDIDFPLVFDRLVSHIESKSFVLQSKAQ